MRCEVPEFARCCFCFPLRYGLLVWAYAKLVFNLFLVFNALGVIVSEFRRNGYFMTYQSAAFILMNIFAIFFFVDLIFHIIFIISAHTKEYRKMNLFYREALFGLALYVFGFVFYFVYLFIKLYVFGLVYGMIIWCFFLWLIISQAYLVILVRSEALKLERNSNANYEFTNHATDEERTRVEKINVIDEENIIA